MRRVMVLIPALLVIVSMAARPAAINDELMTRIESLQDQETVQALVYFREQADIPALNRLLKAEHATLAERNRRVIHALQDMASRSQPAMASYLESLKARGLVEKYEMLWIANLFLVEANRAGIEAIATRQELKELYPNLSIENIRPVNSDYSPGLLTGHETGLSRINAPAAWAHGWTGAGRVVMNIDSGVEGTHPALSARFRGDIDDDGDISESWLDPYDTHYPDPRDDDGHGTHTMGTICGRTADGDTIGVAIDATWMAAAAVDRGGGIQRTVADIIAAFQWAVDPDGNPDTQDNPDAIGNSWGVNDDHGFPPCDETFWQVIDNCEAAGSAVIFSAGNEGPGSATLRRPADRAMTPYNCFSVGAVNGNNDTLPIADFSSRGPSYCTPDGQPAIKPEVVAPGVNIRSSYRGGGYVVMSGTSMASPHVTGAVAVIRQVNPNLSVDEIKDILVNTAHDLPLNNPEGEDNTYGMGIIDLYQACLLAERGFGYVEGYVRDTTGYPIYHARIAATGTPRGAQADSSGHYILGLIAESTYTIQASYFGYLPSDAQATAIAGDTLQIDFELQLSPTGALHGTVIEMINSAPLENALVEVAGAPMAPAITDDAGYYEFAAIPGDSSYMIWVRASGHALGRDTIFVPTGDQASLNFALSPLESFERDNGGWRGSGAWQWGVPTSGPQAAYDGTNVWATFLAGDYPNDADDSLFTCYYVVNEPDATFSFYHWYDIERGYDGGNVSISTDGGNRWSLIEPLGGYPESSVIALGNEPGFSDSSRIWQQAVFDLASYDGMAVQFRLRFASNGSAHRPGWYVDGIEAQGADTWNEGTPHADINPSSFSFNLQQGDSARADLNISNSGDGLLAFGLEPVTRGQVSIGDRMGEPSGRLIGTSNEAAMPLRHQVNAAPKPYYQDSGPNPPMILDSGGPDAFGYSWRDSNEPGGPAYQWADITAIGQQLFLEEEDNQGPFVLGFEMPFYGVDYNSVRISSNGWLSFTSTVYGYLNAIIPSPDEPNALIAPFWDDLNPEFAGDGYFYTNYIDTAIIAWVGIPHYFSIGSYTFEAILTSDGDVTFQYRSMTGPLESNTVGIENADGSIGLQVVCNQAYISDSLAVGFSLRPAWLRVSPVAGFARPGQSFGAVLTLDATGLETGQYAGYLRIDSNDPNTPSVAVPCTLNVVPVGVAENPDPLPARFILAQNYPNPFNPTTSIGFSLPASGYVSLAIYDVMGRIVNQLQAGRIDAGYHTIIWNGTDNMGKPVSSGVYFYTIRAGTMSATRRMLLLK